MTLTLFCSFCGKSQHEVAKLIAGPTVHICGECVDLCHEIMHPSSEPPPSPPADLSHLADMAAAAIGVLQQAIERLQAALAPPRPPKPARPATAEVIGFGASE